MGQSVLQWEAIITHTHTHAHSHHRKKPADAPFLGGVYHLVVAYGLAPSWGKGWGGLSSTKPFVPSINSIWEAGPPHHIDKSRFNQLTCPPPTPPLPPVLPMNLPISSPDSPLPPLHLGITALTAAIFASAAVAEAHPRRRLR